VQGCLRNERLAASLETKCAHCGEALHIEIDRGNRCQVREAGAAPLLFEPQIDWDRFTKRHIIDDY
jgi:hypothetical protein